MVSAILPVPAVQGPWQMTVRPARRLAPNSTKVHAPRTASLVPTMKLKLWNVKVSLWIHIYDLVRCLTTVEYARLSMQTQEANYSKLPVY